MIWVLRSLVGWAGLVLMVGGVMEEEEDEEGVRREGMAEGGRCKVAFVLNLDLIVNECPVYLIITVDILTGMIINGNTNQERS